MNVNYLNSMTMYGLKQSSLPVLRKFLNRLIVCNLLMESLLMFGSKVFNIKTQIKEVFVGVVIALNSGCFGDYRQLFGFGLCKSAGNLVIAKLWSRSIYMCLVLALLYVLTNISVPFCSRF